MLTLTDTGRRAARTAVTTVAGIPDQVRARRQVVRRIESLNPEVDDREISHLLLGRVFNDAWFHQAFFTVSYWRQTAVETIAPILVRRGYGNTLTEVTKRNDDSLLFFGLMYRDGYREPEGQRTIDRLSAIHKTFDIPPDDYRYTIATLCFEAVRLPEFLGIKPALTPAEARALFLFWSGIGREWGVDLHEGTSPEGQRAYRAWYDDYEKRTYKRTDDAIAIQKAMTDCFLDRWAPGPLRPIGEQFLRALADDHLLDAVGLEPASPAMQRITRVAVDAYFRGRRALPGGKDLIIKPWTTEYGCVPDSSEVGPKWAKDIQVQPREPSAAGKCPF